MHSTTSGDSIINHFTKKTCEVIIDFKNGDQIIRRRRPGGSTELLFIKDGNETNVVADTVSTTKAMQIVLNKAFNLDYDIFCGSVFFNQYGRPWMEMSEAARRKALEKILRVDRFGFYSKIAKAKADNCQVMFNNHNSKMEELASRKRQLENDIRTYSESSKTFETKRKQRLKEIADAIEAINLKIADIIIPDIDKLTEKWNIIEKIKLEIDKIKSADLKDFKEQATTEAKLDVIVSKEKDVNGQLGKQCVSCNQPIPSSLVQNNLKKLEAEKSILNETLKEVSDRRAKNTETIKKYEEMLKSKIPNITIVEAKNLSSIVLNHQAEIKRLEKMASDVSEDSDPNDKIIESLKINLEGVKKSYEEAQTRAGELVILDKHYSYLYKCYNDRNKVKSFMCEEHVPYINTRLEHYLNILNLDIKLKIENDLRVSSNMWGYDYQSGGERKRSDLAFMLACFDFYEMMYGRQCNMMVLDEVDGRMDEDGIEGLISIIRNDLATRVDNILIISHRNQMFDVFDREIKVKRVNRLSMLTGN
jgi:hypothetical protein